MQWGHRLQTVINCVHNFLEIDALKQDMGLLKDKKNINNCKM